MNVATYAIRCTNLELIGLHENKTGEFAQVQPRKVTTVQSRLSEPLWPTPVIQVFG